MRRSLIILCVTTLIASEPAHGQRSRPPVVREAPVVVPGARQYDFTSRINGIAYRVMIGATPGVSPDSTCAVLYLLDGNAYFNTAFDAASGQARYSVIRPIVVVGIGYPTGDRPEIIRRRQYDMTTPRAGDSTTAGGADAFLRVIEEEIEPLVKVRFRVDTTRQALFGHSLGGLFALHVLFRHPRAFAAYVASSPSIEWNGRAILREETEFTTAARTSGLQRSLLVSSAGDEQYRGTDRARLARDIRAVDDATELAERLSALPPSALSVTRIVFPGEEHGTVMQAVISRMLRFAFPPGAPAP